MKMPKQLGMPVHPSNAAEENRHCRIVLLLLVMHLHLARSHFAIGNETPKQTRTETHNWQLLAVRSSSLSFLIGSLSHPSSCSIQTIRSEPKSTESSVIDSKDKDIIKHLFNKKGSATIGHWFVLIYKDTVVKMRANMMIASSWLLLLVVPSLLLLLLSVPSYGFVIVKPTTVGLTSTHKSKTTTKTTTTVLGADNLKEFRRGLSKINNGSNNNDEKPLDVVMKFGGSSLADYTRVDHVANLIKDQITSKKYRPRAVVCSAMGKTTNNLLSAGEFALQEGRICVDAIRTLHVTTIDEFQLPQNTKQEITALLDECEQMLNGVRLIQELSPKSLDQLVSYGERCSVRIMAARLNQIGIPAQAFDAWDVGIITNSNFGDANLLQNVYEEKIRKSFERIDSNVVAVVTGFIAHDTNGKITTLGRGGSDLTATALGSALKLDEIQVWKDVDGILTSDPRLVPLAVPVNQVSYEEASELAYFGAQVLHPIAMQPAMKYNIPVRVKNSYNPSAEGTIIQAEKVDNRLVTAITYKRDITVLDIHSTQMLGTYGFLARVFSEFEKHKLSVDVLASSEVSISLTLDKKQDITEIQNLINDLKDCAGVTRKDNMSILTLIADVGQSSQVLATVFRVFAKHDVKVEMMSQGASKVNISFVVCSDQLEEAILQLHQCFFEDSCTVDNFDLEMEINGEPVKQGEESSKVEASS